MALSPKFKRDLAQVLSKRIVEKKLIEFEKEFAAVHIQTKLEKEYFYYRGSLIKSLLHPPKREAFNRIGYNLPSSLHEQGESLLAQTNQLQETLDRLFSGISFVLRTATSISDVYVILPESIHKYLDASLTEETKEGKQHPHLVTDQELEKIRASTPYSYITEQLIINMLMGESR